MQRAASSPTYTSTSRISRPISTSFQECKASASKIGDDSCSAADRGGRLVVVVVVVVVVGRSREQAAVSSSCSCRRNSCHHVVMGACDHGLSYRVFQTSGHCSDLESTSWRTPTRSPWQGDDTLKLHLPLGRTRHTSGLKTYNLKLHVGILQSPEPKSLITLRALQD